MFGNELQKCRKNKKSSCSTYWYIGRPSHTVKTRVLRARVQQMKEFCPTRACSFSFHNYYLLRMLESNHDVDIHKLLSLLGLVVGLGHDPLGHSSPLSRLSWFRVRVRPAYSSLFTTWVLFTFLWTTETTETGFGRLTVLQILTCFLNFPATLRGFAKYKLAERKFLQNLMTCSFLGAKLRLRSTGASERERERERESEKNQNKIVFVIFIPRDRDLRVVRSVGASSTSSAFAKRDQ